MSSNLSARLEKLRWPVMIVKLRKGQKHSKSKNIKILKTISLSEETIQYPYFKLQIVSLAHKDP